MGYISLLINKKIREYFKDLDIKEYIDIQKTNENIDGDFTILLSKIIKNTNINRDDFINRLTINLKNDNIISDFNVIGVFLNIKLTDKFLIKVFDDVIYDKNDFILNKNENSKKNVVVEYSSPNTNKPLHLGHLRNNFLGYSMCQIYKECGYNVYSVSLVNDRGIHICKSMVTYMMFGDNKTPKDLNIKGDHYIGDFYVKFDKIYKQECANYEKDGKKNIDTPIMIEANKLLEKWEQGDKETICLWRKMTRWVLNGFKETYKRIGVEFDKVYYESSTYLLGKDIVEKGLKKKVFYKKDDGSIWIDLTDEGMDEKLLLRSNGTSVYITQDLGTIELRYEDFKFEKMIYVVGDEQIYHFKVLKLILKKLGIKYYNDVYHLSYGMVELPNGKMKSREGTVVDADDIIDEMILKAKEKTEELGKLNNISNSEKKKIYEIIGLDALKFYLLKVDAKKRILFDPNTSIDFHGDTGPFILYTYVRLNSILSKCLEDEKIKKKKNVHIIQKVTIGIDYDNINLTDIEKKLIITLSDYYDIVLKSAKECNPSLLAQYILTLSKESNKFYENTHVCSSSDINKQNLDILLISKILHILQKSMALLGLKTISKM